MIRWNVSQAKERVLLWLARKMPRSLRYWATIVAGAEATTGKYGNTIVPELKFVDVLKRIEPGAGA